MSDDTWYGFYSNSAANKIGAAIYQSKDNPSQKFYVTNVSRDKDGKCYKWDDKFFVGELKNCKCIKKIDKDNSLLN